MQIQTPLFGLLFDVTTASPAGMTGKLIASGAMMLDRPLLESHGYVVHVSTPAGRMTIPGSSTLVHVAVPAPSIN